MCIERALSWLLITGLRPFLLGTSGWHGSGDFIREKAKLEERAPIEEENFIPVPYSKEEKKN